MKVDRHRPNKKAKKKRNKLKVDNRNETFSDLVYCNIEPEYNYNPINVLIVQF